MSLLDARLPSGGTEEGFGRQVGRARVSGLVVAVVVSPGASAVLT